VIRPHLLCQKLSIRLRARPWESETKESGDQNMTPSRSRVHLHNGHPSRQPSRRESAPRLRHLIRHFKKKKKKKKKKNERSMADHGEKKEEEKVQPLKKKKKEEMRTEKLRESFFEPHLMTRCPAKKGKKGKEVPGRTFFPFFPSDPVRLTFPSSQLWSKETREQVNPHPQGGDQK